MRELTNEEMMLVSGGNGYTNALDVANQIDIISSAIDWGNLAAEAHQNALGALHADINAFFLYDGMYRPDQNGTGINSSMIDWSLYDANGTSPEAVLQEFYRIEVNGGGN